MGCEISRSTYEQVIGAKVIDYVNAFRPYELSPLAESEAFKLISKIKTILAEDGLSDQECFYRIDAIVNAFHESSLDTSRHDW